MSKVSSAEEEKVGRILAKFEKVQAERFTFSGHWEEVAQLILPDRRNTFYAGNRNTPGQKNTQRQIDAQGALALRRFGAILDSLITPRNQKWHVLAADNPYVMKDRATRLWFEEVTRILFAQRYAADSGFVRQNYQNWLEIGAFGTSYIYTDSLIGGRGLRYKNLPVGEVYVIENHQGIVDGYFRFFRWNAYEAASVPGWRERLPEKIKLALEKGEQTLFDFIQYVSRREDYDPERIDALGKPFESCYVSIDGRQIMSEGGYRSMPLAAARYEQFGNERYGRSPAMMVLPALKGKNAMKSVFLKQGHRAADPVLLTTDDGAVDMSLRPGAINKGGMTVDGKPLVGVLPTGNHQITETMLDSEGMVINDAFLVSLFQILTESPQMTATEVIERTNEKGILLAPTVGGVADERLSSQIDRELDELAVQGLLPPMPPRLREAQGEYKVDYTNPLAKAAKAQEAAGFMRTLESVKELVSITQDGSLLDPFDFDVAVPAIAEIQSVPESWMASPDQVALKRKKRAQAQQQQAQIQAAPAEAALMKARAAMMQSGNGGMPQ